jgi:hypothetical protein
MKTEEPQTGETGTIRKARNRTLSQKVPALARSRLPKTLNSLNCERNTVEWSSPPASPADTEGNGVRPKPFVVC